MPARDYNEKPNHKMKLFLNPNRVATDSLTRSTTDATSTSVKPLFFGDNLPLEITFHDGNGAFPDNLTEATIKVAIGTFTGGTPLLEEEITLAPNSGVANFTLDLRTQAFDDATLGLENTAAIFEIESTKGQETKTIHQSTIQIRNQMLSQQSVTLTLPSEPTIVVAEELPLPDAPSNVQAAADPDEPSNIQVIIQTIPEEPTQVDAGILPAAPTQVTAGSDIDNDATPSNVEAHLAATFSFFGQQKSVPLKIKVEETSPGSLTGTNAEFLKGRTFIWDGSETYEPSTHYGGNSYTGAPVWRSGGEEPGAVANPTDMTAQYAFDNMVFRIFAQSISTTEITWRIQYARPEGKWTGGLIGQNNGVLPVSNGQDPSSLTFSTFRLRPGENVPLAPSETELGNLGAPSNVQVQSSPQAPTNIQVGKAPPAPSNVIPTDLCYHIDPTGKIGINSYILANAPFELTNGQQAKPGEIFQVTTYSEHDIFQVTSLQSTSRIANLDPSEFRPGDQIIAIKSFTKRNGEVIISVGDQYEVVRVSSQGIPIINTDPQVGLGANELKHFKIGYNGAWHLLRMENCSSMSNIEVKVDNGGNLPFNGYYQAINPAAGAYEDDGSFQTNANVTGASVYKKVRNLDCSLPAGEYYIYRNLRTATDMIWIEWRAHSTIAPGNTSSGFSLASPNWEPLADLSFASPAPANSCRVTEIQHKLESTTPADYEGYYSVFETRTGWYEPDGTFVPADNAPGGIPLQGASAYRKERGLSCENDLISPGSTPGAGQDFKNFIFRSRVAFGSGYDSPATTWSWGAYLHETRGTFTAGGTIPWEQYPQVEPGLTWTQAAPNSCPAAPFDPYDIPNKPSGVEVIERPPVEPTNVAVLKLQINQQPHYFGDRSNFFFKVEITGSDPHNFAGYYQPYLYSGQSNQGLFGGSWSQRRIPLPSFGVFELEDGTSVSSQLSDMRTRDFSNTIRDQVANYGFLLYANRISNGDTIPMVGYYTLYKWLNLDKSLDRRALYSVNYPAGEWEIGTQTNASRIGGMTGVDGGDDGKLFNFKHMSLTPTIAKVDDPSNAGEYKWVFYNQYMSGSWYQIDSEQLTATNKYDFLPHRATWANHTITITPEIIVDGHQNVQSDPG